MTLKRKVKKIIRVKLAAILASVGNRNYQRFIILSRSRSGSNLLVDLLNSHPNIRCEREIFRRLAGRSVESILQRAYARLPYYIQAKGFKIFYYHPLDDEGDKVWQELHAIEDLKVIHLKRKNILQTVVSRKLAEISQVWTETQFDQPTAVSAAPVFELSADELRSSFESTESLAQKAEEFFSQHDCLTVYYEDLVAERNPEFNRITQFLGVKDTLPKTTLRKQNKRSLREIIVNYEDLKLAFQGSRWAKFFAED